MTASWRGRCVAAALVVGAAGCGAQAPDVAVQDAWVTVGAARLFTRLVGHGPDTLVVLHGGPSFGARYLEQALRPLARRHALLFYDQRGRGRSGIADSADLTFDTDLLDLEAVRQHYHLGTMTVIGHHYGAALGAVYAARHPGIVTRLAGIGPLYPRHNYVYDLSRITMDSASQAMLWQDMAHGGDTVASPERCARDWEWWLSPAVESDAKTVAALAPAVCGPEPVSFRAGERINRRVIQSLGQWDWRDSARVIPIPVLIVQGEGGGGTDEARERSSVLRHAAETWVAFLPDARLMVLPGASWFPWAGRAGALADVLDAFLAGRWPDGAIRVAQPPATPTPLATMPDSTIGTPGHQ